MPVGSVTKAIIALGAKDWNEETSQYFESTGTTQFETGPVFEPAQPSMRKWLVSTAGKAGA